MPKVPWNLLLNQLPTLLRAADTLLDTTAKRNAARETAPVLDVLQRRLSAVEDEQRMTAELLKQLTENVGSVAQAAQESSATLRRVQTMAAIALGLAVLACVLVIVLWVRG